MVFLDILSFSLLVTLALCQSPAEKAKAMVAKMTLEEKVVMLHGLKHKTYTGNTPENKRLGIPPLNLNDGPQGFREGGSTCWPAAITVAATFDTPIAKQWGEGMGQEFYDKGANVQLGPGLCLARVPINGRNFEYLSGEDPFLGYRMVHNVIIGIQSRNVIANAKHWVNNNQETNRQRDNAVVDERTRFEMYYPPFEGAIEAGLGSVMCSYNKINGRWSCENNGTLHTDLKTRLGFKGWVMSDWGATHSTSIMEGLDQEMPHGTYMGDPLIAMVKAGNITMAKIDESVIRILTPMYAIGIFDHAEQWVNASAHGADVTSAAHSRLARHVASAGTVLLKNNGILPLRPNAKVALLGHQAVNPTVYGQGSGHVTPTYVINPLDGINERLSKNATTGDESDISAAAKVAKDADLAIVFVGTVSGEGHDRANLSFPEDQEALVNATIKAQPHTIVVCFNPGAVLMPWAKDAAAVLTMFMPGLEAGHSLADILFGIVNPSGRLPLSLPNIENEVQFTPAMYPGVDGKSEYSEKLLVGYRWYDEHDVVPHFPFGHGLSYTTFVYSNLQIAKTKVTFSITNTGHFNGAEVAQLYLGFPKSAGEPPFQLKEFQKTQILKIKEEVTINFELSDRAFSIWDVKSHAWEKVSGQFIVHVGASSRDIRLKGSITI